MSEKRVLIVQYSGDYREAYRRAQASGSETYYGHKYVLEQLAALRLEASKVGILCCNSPSAYHDILPTGVEVLGAAADPRWKLQSVLAVVRSFAPTHLVVLGPLTGVIRWGLQHRCRLLAIFADSFPKSPMRRFLRHGRLQRFLTDERVEWIANHGMNASRALMELGVPAAKILPWDWPHYRQPKEQPAKTFAPGAQAKLLYVGMVSVRKGVGDIINAMAHLKSERKDVHLDVVGGGDVEKFKALATALKVADHVSFLGLQSNSDVHRLMRDASLVLVPSQHAYPEGFPLTIYEALCARTPIVASDHPMFRNFLRHKETAMIFRSGRPAELAECVKDVLASPGLYEALSNSSQETWQSLQIDLKWGDLLRRWVRDGTADREWLSRQSLASSTRGQTRAAE